jgi:GPI mannosyltransferase 4
MLKTPTMKKANEIKSSTTQQCSSKIERNQSKSDSAIAIKSKSLLPLPKAWFFLVAIRFGLNIFGQRGYIHPDEFFQSIEPLVGDLFNCSDKVLKTWEFNFMSTRDNQSQQQQPIRNMLIPYTFYGLPLLILKWLSSLFSTTSDYSRLSQEANELSINLISVQSNTIIYFPRMFMTLASLIVDMATLKVSEMCELDSSSILIALASSYISMVYLTRTLSNSIETILFALLLYAVIKSIKAQQILNEKFLMSMSNKSDPSSVSLTQTSTIKEIDHKLAERKAPLKNNRNDNHTNALKRLRLFDIYKFDYLGSTIGLIVCVGIFNRPTFILFALAPLSYWLLYGLDNCSSKQQAITFVARRTLSLCACAMPFAFLFALFDTAYFNQTNNLEDLLYLVLQRKLIITPYNFFVYNSNKSNLAQHGQHPFYQHILFNCFLLFGINYLLLVIISVQFFSHSTWLFLNKNASDHQLNSTLSKRKRLIEFIKHLLSSAFEIYFQIINNTFCFFAIGFTIPLILFTCIPHQEPRFLLPLLIPVILLTSHCIFGARSCISVRILWIVFNLVCVFVYGYVHQGGLVASLHYAQKVAIHTGNLNVDQHFIFYHTYMPPRSLIVAPFALNVVNNKRYLFEGKRIRDELEYEYDKSKSLSTDGFNLGPPERQIYDLMSSSEINELETLIESIKKNYTSKSKVKKDYAIFLIAPSPHNIHLELSSLRRKLLKKQPISYQLQTRFRLHIGFEDLLDHIDCFKCAFSLNDEDTKIKESLILYSEKCKKTALLNRIFNCFSLNFYQVLF